MTAERRQPFATLGGIETSVGARRHPMIVDNFYNAKLDVIPSNPEASAEAKTLNRLYKNEPSVLCDLYGNPWIHVIVPSHKKGDNGRLVERWIHPTDIFEARDETIEIIEKYSKGGIQYKKRDLAAKTMNLVANRLQEGPLNEEEELALRNQAMLGMVNSGYLSSVYPERVKTANDVIRATEKDSRGRPNSSVGRMIVASRRPQNINHGLVDGRVVKKNKRKLTVIESVCDLLEQDFENLERFAVDLSENKIGTRDFETELPRFLRTVDLLLSPEVAVLPKPYSGLGAKIRYAVYPKHRPLEDPLILSRYMDPFEGLDVRDQFLAGFDELEGSKQKRERIVEIAKVIAVGRNVIAIQRYGEKAA